MQWKGDAGPKLSIHSFRAGAVEYLLNPLLITIFFFLYLIGIIYMQESEVSNH